MPQRSTYTGRHRGRHRAEVQKSSRGVAIPGAAAAALTLTATGAAVVPGLSGSAAAGEANAAGPAPRTSGVDPSTGSQQIQDASARVDQAELEARVEATRVQAQARASRELARERIAEKRRKAVAEAHHWVLPVVHYRFSSPYGMRWGRLHAGDDFAAPIGTRVGALSSGTVVFAGQESGYGNKIEIRHWDGTVSWYGHLSVIGVKVGQKVSPGERIGEVGNTGHSTGPHLHLEIHPDGGGPVNPLPWLRAHGLKV